MTSQMYLLLLSWLKRPSCLKHESLLSNGLEKAVLQNLCKKWTKKFKIRRLILEFLKLRIWIQNFPQYNKSSRLNLITPTHPSSCSTWEKFNSSIASTPSFKTLPSFTPWLSTCPWTGRLLTKQKVLEWTDFGQRAHSILLPRILTFQKLQRRSARLVVLILSKTTKWF